MRVLVTGANGFIGQHLCRSLAMKGEIVRAAVRRKPDVTSRAGPFLSNCYGCEETVVGNIGPDTDWTEALKGVEVIVHLAARVHIMREREVGSNNLHRYVNTLGTERIARMASQADVRRLIYVSTIKVNGEATRDSPFTEEDIPKPSGPYAESKWEAERILRDIADKSSLEVVVLRPPLVYGPNVKGNILQLLHCVNRGIPLPLLNINNRRSMIGVDNFVDLIEHCIYKQSACGETFLAADEESVSTPVFIRVIAEKLEKRIPLFPFPPTLLRFGATLLRKRDLIDRLCGSLEADTSKIRTLLDWSAPVPLERGLEKMAMWYMERYSKKHE